MTKQYIISRHQATIAWVRTQLRQELEVHDHLDQTLFAGMQPGDQVIGNLPLEWVARLTSARIIYWAVNLDYSAHPSWRGKDLTLEQLTLLTPELSCYKAYLIKKRPHSPTTHME